MNTENTQNKPSLDAIFGSSISAIQKNNPQSGKPSLDDIFLDRLPDATKREINSNESSLKKNIKGLGQDISQRGQNIADIQQAREQGKSATMEALKIVSPELAAKVEPALSVAQKIKSKLGVGLDVAKAGQVAGAVDDTLGNILMSIPGVEKVTSLIGKEIGKVVPDVLAKAGVNTIEEYNAFAEQNPMIAKNLEGAVNIASLLPVGGAAKVGVETVEQGAKAVTKVGGMAGGAGAKVGELVSPVTSSVMPVAETIGSTVKSAVRRGKEAIVEGVEESKRISKLPEAEKQAVRSGLDTGVIDFVKTTSKENIPVYQEIVGAAKAGADNLRGGTKAKEVVGKMIIDKAVSPAIKIKNTVGKKLGKAVEILPKVPENVTPLREEFAKVLESVGVRVGKSGKLVSTRGGVKGDLTAYQNMWDRIKSGYASQREIHDIRSAVFKEFDLAKARQTPFSSQADNVAEQFRSILGKGISNKQYLELSKQYSEAIRPLQEFVKYIGYKGDIEKLGTQNLRVAEIAQRVLGNASARPQEVLDTITSLADKAGKGKLSKDISDAIRFSDLIEDFYGLQQTRSLAGQVAKGTKAGVEGATESVIQGAANGGVTGMVGSVVKGVLGKTSAEQQKALDALLSSLSKTKPKK